MSLGHLPKITASLLLALYLFSPGSVAVHLLEESIFCGHAEEPIHLEQRAPMKNGMQSGSLLCSVCDHGDAAIPAASRNARHLAPQPSYLTSGMGITPERIPDPPFIPPENV